MRRVINQTFVSASRVRMERGISEIAGRVDLASGGNAPAYRALRPLLCSSCTVIIAEGALFTRHKLKGIGVSLMPRCQQCEPFVLSATKAEKSALLKSLLAGQHTPPVKNPDSTLNDSPQESSQLQEDKKNIAREVQKRLGPALKRGRRV